SELCLGLVAPAAPYFRRVDTFAYVDRLCPITIEHGHLTPDGPLDLHARSDFGRVLDELLATRAGLLRRRTLLLVVGDARNNRFPAARGPAAPPARSGAAPRLARSRAPRALEHRRQRAGPLCAVVRCRARVREPRRASVGAARDAMMRRMATPIARTTDLAPG